MISNSSIARLRFPPWVFAAASLLILIIILWLPFGWNVIGIQEEWSNRAYVEDGDGPWLRYERYSRPGKLIPITLAHTLTPDSFVGYNIVQAALFFGKGMMFYFLMRRLIPGLPIVALAGALLFIIYPADEGLMTMRSTPIHFATFCFLTALNLLLAYWERPRWFILLGMWLALGLSVGTYEIAYPLALASPIFLLWLEKRLNARVIRLSLLWYAGFLLPMANSLIHFGQPNSMQRNLLEAGTADRNLLTFFQEMLESLILAYQRHFIFGWQTAVQQVSLNSLYLLLAGVVAFGVLVVAWLISRNRAVQDTPPFSRRYFIFVIVGILWIALALVLYLPTTRRYEDWRVYYMSSAGASLAVTVLILVISHLISRRFANWLFTGLMALLIGLAVVRILHQHQRYVDVGLREAYILGRIIEEVPTLKSQAYYLLVPPESGEPLPPERLYLAQAFDAALSLIYEDYAKVLGVDFCYPPDISCRFYDNGVEVSGIGTPRKLYPYDQILLFESSTHGGINLLSHVPDYLLSGAMAENYAPEKIIDSGSQEPRRVHTLFARWPIPFNYPLVAEKDFAEFVIPDYENGIPVILETANPNCISQSDCTIQTWLSGDVVDVPDSDRIYITPERTATSENLEQLQTMIGDSESVWYVRTGSSDPQVDEFRDALSDYAPFRTTPWNGRYYPEIAVYRKKPDNLRDIFLFGDSISLQNWTLHNDVNVQPCQAIQLSTWWFARDRIDVNYSMTLVLADDSGVGIARTDGAPSNFLPQLWQVGGSYLDERTLTIPCDIQSGTYPLLMGLYNYETVEPLLALDGTSASGLVYLTTLNVQ